MFGSGSTSNSMVAVTQKYHDSSASNSSSSTFYLPSGLKTVTVTDGVILYGAFYNWDMIEKVVLGDDVTSIEHYTFYDCDGLKEIVIGNGVTSIGSNAFYDCYSLTEIVIPDSVNTIGSRAFYYCSVLKVVTLGSGVTTISSEAFYYCNALKEIVIPNSVTTISESAFYSTKLEKVILGTGITNISSYAFSNDCDVYYLGSAEDWTQNGNATFSDAKLYYYSEEAPSLNEAGTAYDGNYWHYVGDEVTPWVYEVADGVVEEDLDVAVPDTVAVPLSM